MRLACWAEIDWSVGQVLDKLKELGIDDNTVVLFVSDNGGARRHGAQNGPLRGGKGGTWEGGHRVCALVRWPGHIPAGTASDELVSSLDVLPTFAALAGTKVPKDRKIDGLDIRPVLLEKHGRSQDRFRTVNLTMPRIHLNTRNLAKSPLAWQARFIVASSGCSPLHACLFRVVTTSQTKAATQSHAKESPIRE